LAILLAKDCPARAGDERATSSRLDADSIAGTCQLTKTRVFGRLPCWDGARPRLSLTCPFRPR